MYLFPHFLPNSGMDKTFDDIPNDVFDRIPRAVSARAEKRLIKLQEQMLQENMLLRQQASQNPNPPEQVKDNFFKSMLHDIVLLEMLFC